MSSPTKPRENCYASLEVMPSRYCSRKLKPGQVKRYMSKGPLFGYMIACPGCGFIELHQQDKTPFIEENGQLVSMLGSTSCLACAAVITIGFEKVWAAYAGQSASG